MTSHPLDSRLPTALWVDSHLRQLNSAGMGYYVAQKGAYAGGTVLVKLNLLNGFAKVLSQIRGPDGQLGWMNALKDETVAESDADQYIRRAIDRDPDLWVIEIEDKNGVNPFEGKLLL